MKLHTYHTLPDRGIGMMATIAIIAVLGIGGVAAVQVYNQQNAEIGADEQQQRETTDAKQREIATAKEDARQQLLSIRSDLAADLDANVDATLRTLAEIRADLADAYAGANAEFRAELNSINAALNEIEAGVETASESAVEATDDAILRLQSGSESEAGVNGEGSFNIDASGNQGDAAGDDRSTENETNTDASVGVEATTSIDGNGVNGSVEGTGELEVQ